MDVSPPTRALGLSWLPNPNPKREKNIEFWIRLADAIKNFLKKECYLVSSVGLLG